jgi:hypothetical protein
MKKSLTYLLLLSFPVIFKAQEKATQYKYSSMTWIGYYNTIKLNERLTVGTDLQYRTRNGKTNQALARTGLGWKITEKISVIAGIAHFRHYYNAINSRAEWRPWQEIAFSDDDCKLRMSHRLRSEQRYIEKLNEGRPCGHFDFNWRFRYKLDLQYSLATIYKKRIILAIGNEVMINAGNEIVFNYFDQNRLYAGISLELTKNLSVQVQAMQIWQQKSNGIAMDKISVIRLNVFHKINL